MKKILLALVIIACWWWLRPQPVLVENSAQGYQAGDYRITVLQDSFTLTARVLGREDYSLGREADISATDLALGWGSMAQPDIYSQFEIRQSNRWYYWQASRLPIPRRDVERQSANMHMIAADAAVAQNLAAVRKHQLIQLQGKLVRVDASDGWHWVSSLSRDDVGNGACELVLLEAIQIVSD